MKSDRYTESGLDNVIIEGAQVLVDDAGDFCVTISERQWPSQGDRPRDRASAFRDDRPRIAILRTEMGMTQAELAGLVHREPLAISRWERGEIEIDSNAETSFADMRPNALACRLFRLPM